jgi:hypothetical protein
MITIVLDEEKPYSARNDYSYRQSIENESDSITATKANL